MSDSRPYSNVGHIPIVQVGKGSLGENMRKKNYEKCFDSINSSILIQSRYAVINNCPKGLHFAHVFK